jgi:uncharacterized integral membrane protein
MSTGNKVRIGIAAALGLVAVLLAAFNWKLFVDRAELNLLFGSVEAPVGLILLTVVLGLVLVHVVGFQTQKLVQDHRLEKAVGEARAETAREQERLRGMQQAVRTQVGSVRQVLDRIDKELGGSRPAPEA